MFYLSENMKYLRARKGRSQQELADDLGITRSRYSKYEYGLAEPSIVLLAKLAEYYRITLDALILQELRENSASIKSNKY
ncbi:helix-turn-helix transcriptional regulator [Sphingobacterium olei]|uniref:Helix-turn-helix transcriptional regulator n=2 Tax=Sphingobacterium olei TaxID=2571155 RepID=A0A4U0NIF1_9SPHI|nr:helix-turn-helix transcriptional regulator [Sphingobacterium olei]